MPNKKSFDLKKDDKKSSEKLYQPKKFRWCKFIVLPLLFGFVLLLILINVDFSGKVHNETILEINEDINGELYNQTMMQMNARMYNPGNKIRGTLSQIKTSLSRALNCISSADSCTLTCVGGNINNIYKQLEPLYKTCNKDLNLQLIDCSFPSSRLKSNFFQGNYRLQSVNISNCNLASIQNKAFTQESVRNLKNLTLSNTQFLALDMTAFEGLEQLENFYLNNEMISWSLFKGVGFLQYFSETLTTLTIQQKSLATTIYDPLPWLQGKNMKNLISVNLANNNFQNILNSKTFSNLVAVEYLNLSNSSITYLEVGVFDSVLRTLKHLDLSNNYLMTLPEEMLHQMPGLELNLSFNYWQCTCDNQEMLRIIKWNLTDIVFLNRENIKCYTPNPWRNEPIDSLVLDCLVTTTTVDISETTGNETDTTSEPTTTTIIIHNNTTITTKITNKPMETTTKSSTDKNSSSSDSSSSSSDSSSSSSSQTSEETDETAQETDETTTPMITTTITDETTTTSRPLTTSTTRKSTTKTTPKSTTTTTATPPPSEQEIKIYCHNTDNEVYVHDILKEKCLFSVKPISATSVKIVTKNFLTKMAIIYFQDNKNYTIIPNLQLQQRNEYFTIIKNLNTSSNYVFCLLQQLHKIDNKIESDQENYNWFISPFDCRSFSWPETFPQPWLEKDDKVWIISLVVLGTCLMAFLGIILMVIVVRWKKSNNKNNYTRTLVRDLEMEPNYLQPTNRVDNTVIVPPGRLYISRHQPPDVVIQHVNFNSNHDLYEELIM